MKATVTVKGGNRINAELAKLIARLKRAKSVSVGFQNGAREEKTGTPVALVAALNEYGVPAHGQPPRPFFRGMIDRNKGSWGGILAGGINASNGDTARAFGQLGEVVKGQLVNSIRELTSPPLAPSTIARKGFDKPLVDTSLMLHSVTAVVDQE